MSEDGLRREKAKAVLMDVTAGGKSGSVHCHSAESLSQEFIWLLLVIKQRYCKSNHPSCEIAAILCMAGITK